MWTDSCHREAAWQTVVYKENVPINPDEAGHANIYPEGGRSLCCGTVKIQLISVDFSKSNERQCEHCPLEEGFKGRQECILWLRYVSRRWRHRYRSHFNHLSRLQLEYKGGSRTSSCVWLLWHFQMFQSSALLPCVSGWGSCVCVRNYQIQLFTSWETTKKDSNVNILKLGIKSFSWNVDKFPHQWSIPKWEEK